MRVSDVVDRADRMRLEAERCATRAAVVNLVVQVVEESEARVVAETLAGLGAHHPGRIIVVQPAPDAPAGLDATVELFQAADGAQQLWWEVIRLSVGGPAAHHLASVVEPLLLHDLHLAVWHTGPLPAPDELLAAAGQVLIGGTSAHDPHAAAGRLAARRAAVERLSRLRPVTDLAWLRAEPWRRALARLFDPPDARALLADPESASTSGRPWPALLLAGWLADRLSLDPSRVDVRPTDGPPVVELVAGGRRARAAEEPADTVRAGIDGAAAGTSVALRPGGTAGLLAAALAGPRRDPSYEAALAAARGLVA